MLTVVDQDRPGIVLQVKNIKGFVMTYHCDGFKSRAVQHELDHLGACCFSTGWSVRASYSGVRPIRGVRDKHTRFVAGARFRRGHKARDQ